MPISDIVIALPRLRALQKGWVPDATFAQSKLYWIGGICTPESIPSNGATDLEAIRISLFSEHSWNPFKFRTSSASLGEHSHFHLPPSSLNKNATDHSSTSSSSGTIFLILPKFAAPGADPNLWKSILADAPQAHIFAFFAGTSIFINGKESTLYNNSTDISTHSGVGVQNSWKQSVRSCETTYGIRKALGPEHQLCSHYGNLLLAFKDRNPAAALLSEFKLNEKVEIWGALRRSSTKKSEVSVSDIYFLIHPPFTIGSLDEMNIYDYASMICKCNTISNARSIFR
jgi:hypothetical protein